MLPVIITLYAVLTLAVFRLFWALDKTSRFRISLIRKCETIKDLKERYRMYHLYLTGPTFQKTEWAFFWRKDPLDGFDSEFVEFARD
jgi:hypothetical protein